MQKNTTLGTDVDEFYSYRRKRYRSQPDALLKSFRRNPHMPTEEEPKPAWNKQGTRAMSGDAQQSVDGREESVLDK